ncbi:MULTISPECIES: C1 family peptidase [unclassified Butyrivibrio]|uniref:C1 family peptidase n=1 Tax=unclassified Butyrivibrio TaxID=2639466 RepID=UPI0003B372AB|nr:MULTISPECIES: C1 family peptidase [unclassified Butyrivibrio]
MTKNKIAVTVIRLTVTVLFTCAICACANSEENEDPPELFEKIPEGEHPSELARAITQVDEDTKPALSESKTDDISASDDAQEETGEANGEEVDIEELQPIDIKELEVSEAIVIDDADEDLITAADGTETDYESISDDTELPSFYTSDKTDNRDYITAVRNQGDTALCWNFAALGAVESNLLKKHEDLETDSLNLSEKHGAYYNMHKAEGSAGGGIDEDYREFVYEEGDGFLSKYDTGYLSVGGVTDYCLSILTAWKGPVVDENMNSIHVLRGQNDFYTQNADVPTDAYGNAVCHVQNVMEVPATEKNRELIKRLIVKHGSVTASICADDDYWTGKKVALYDYKKYGNGNYADHEVLIVGWNDDYPAANFITKPSENGAFICRNSWGTKYGASGYFYLSYEDSILCNNNVAAYDCAMPEDDNWYDTNYQYAGFLTHIKDPIIDQENVVYMFDKNNAEYGIVFSPESDEELSAFGYFTMSTLSNDTASIYELPGEADGSNADYYSISVLGSPIITMDCKSITGGYHTFSLTEKIEVQKDKKYILVIKPGKEQYLVYEKAMDYTTEQHKDEWHNNLGSIHTVNTASGHSYLVDRTGNYMLRQDERDFFVKIYTKKIRNTDLITK